MAFQLNDRLPPARGIFTLLVWRHGKLVEEYVDDNLVVDLAKEQMAHLIAGDTTDRFISQIAFGTNGTAPAPGNTAITDPYVKAIGAASYPTDHSVQFAFSLDSGEANGKAIIEFGLLTGAGALFARKVRAGAIYKESDLSLTGTWRIIF